MRLSALIGSSNGALVPVGAAAADPVVRSVVTTDLLDPSRYLSGGELVLTGMAWWRPQHPRRTGEFVGALVAARVAALAAGEAESGAVPEDLVDACARAGLPLLRVPLEVSFAAVTDHVGQHLSPRRSGDLAAVLGRHRALMAAASGSGLDGALELVCVDLDLRCWVLSPTGRVVAGMPSPPHERERTLIARNYLRAPRLPHVLRRSARRSVSIFGAGSGSPRGASWFLAIAEDHSGWSDDRLRVAEELASLVGQERDLSRHRSDVEQHLAAALARPGSADEIADGVRRCGLDPTLSAVVVAGSGPLAAAVLAEAFAAESSAWALGEAGDEALAVVTTAEAPAGLVQRLATVVETLAPGLGAEPLRIGVSDVVTGPAGFLGAVAEARTAALTTATVDRFSVAGPERLSSHTVLLAAVPMELRRAYHARVLGPLIDHDQAHRTDLVRTLSTYLACSGSWSRCAAQMHLHVNTLRYRIERIEALTGRDLRRLEDQADLLLALRARSPL